MSLFFHSALIFVTQWTSFIFGLDEPKFDFHPPVKIDMVLAANFGELRKNHFHMGIDIKTNGKTGLKLYSIDEGYVSRIKISPYGYGKVIYSDHPGGITSVYAHCEDFPEKILKTIEEHQIQSKQNEIDLYLMPNALKVDRGEHIAFSGNTGHSFGPHLHFEIRDTQTEEALNPLLYGFKVKDNMPPVVRYLKIYGLNEEGVPNGTEYETRIKGNASNFNLGTIVLPKKFVNSPKIGFALDCYDVYNGSSNKLGVYEFHLHLDSERIISSQLERIPFETTRYINTYSDPYCRKTRQYHKLFYSDYNRLDVYKGKSNGAFALNKVSDKKIEISLKDVYGNGRAISFQVKTPEFKGKTEAKSYNLVHPDSTYIYETAIGRISLPQYLSYYPFSFQWTLSEGLANISNPGILVQEAYEVCLKSEETDKSYLGYSEGNSYSNLYTTKTKNELSAQLKEFGYVKILTDSIAPEIRRLTRTRR